MLVGFVFAMVFCVQSLFLERLAEQRGFHDIKVFFVAYSPTAIGLRIALRHLPARFGRTRTMLLGMGLLAVGLLCLVGVRQAWWLVLPGVLMGAGHCFVFPSMVDLAAERLPAAHRGIGTSLILGASDAGMLVGYASLGEIIDRVGFGTSLVALAGTVVAASGFVAVARRHAVGSGRARSASAGSS